MKHWKKRLSAAAAVMLAAVSLCACGVDGQGGKEAVQISVWSYYNGTQLTAFNDLVREFNETVGAEKDIVVTSHSLGDINELTDRVIDCVEGKVGAEAIPNIFSAYPDAAYAFDQQGLLADVAPYLTEEEKTQYVDGFLAEGDFYGDGSLKILPVAKATEVFLLNKTDWDVFAQATGATYDDFSTLEKLTELSRTYYEWTDSLTEEPNDGKAFFGRDAMDNYFYVGAMQLGEELFVVENGKATVQFSEQTARKFWDNYYVPFVKGWFAASGRFRTDDVKIGSVLGLIGSSASATYFPAEVMLEDGSSYTIEMEALPCPQFEGSTGYTVQQGAGMVVTAAEEKVVAASVEFLKWFTRPEQNVRFSVESGYLPVTDEANNMEVIARYEVEIDAAVKKILKASVETVKENESYTSLPFARGEEARKVLRTSMSDLAAANRATVEERIAAGMSAEDAAAEFVSEEAFLAWYSTTLAALQAIAE